MLVYCLPYALAVGVGWVYNAIIMCTHSDTMERDGGWLGCLAIPPYQTLHERERERERDPDPTNKPYKASGGGREK
jgi:hypothetical protein